MLSALNKRSRKGAGFLFFLTMMFPVMIGAVGLSVDFGRLIIAHRQAADTADSVALAAAHAFNNSSGGAVANSTLNATNSRIYAQETFKFAVGTNKGNSMLNAVENPKLTNVRLTNSSTAVEVTVTYKLTGFAIMDYLTGTRNDSNFTVKRTAQICSKATIQYCAYPVT